MGRSRIHLSFSKQNNIVKGINKDLKYLEGEIDRDQNQENEGKIEYI